jgi:hypothetical protein
MVIPKRTKFDIYDLYHTLESYLFFKVKVKVTKYIFYLIWLLYKMYVRLSHNVEQMISIRWISTFLEIQCAQLVARITSSNTLKPKYLMLIRMFSTSTNFFIRQIQMWMVKEIISCKMNEYRFRKVKINQVQERYWSPLWISSVQHYEKVWHTLYIIIRSNKIYI